MLEIFIPFAAGYLFARLIITRQTPCDRILGWNRDCLGWRPVVSPDSFRPENKYLVCYEVDGETAESLIRLIN